MIAVKTVQAEATDSRDIVPVMYLVIEGAEDIAAFKRLVQAGTNLEPNTSPAMKELADLVTVGHIQQSYRS
jgi:hypothetical protein